MKKQLIFLIFLTVLTNANEETLIDDKNKDLLMKEKKEEIKDLKFILQDKTSFLKTSETPNPSSKYVKASDADISKNKKVSLMDVVLETVAQSDLLKSSREAVIQSELNLQDAISGYYPTLNFQYDSGRTRGRDVGGEKRFK